MLQERLLAPRTVHFTKEQVFWESPAHMACEMYPGGIQTAPECGGHHAHVGLNDIHIHREQDTDEETNRGLPKEAIEWGRIVDHFTMCDLTVASDKLIALSGIAREFHRTRLSPGDEYLAGLWKSQMPNALFWGMGRSREGDSPSWSRPNEYRAPSWSWVSIVGPITLSATEQQPGHWYHTFTELLDAGTTTVGNNPTGQVTGGFLHLLVLFANATWEKVDGRMELAEIFKPSGESWDVRKYSSLRLSCDMGFDVQTECGKVITTPIVSMQYNAPIERTRHNHSLVPSIYGFVLEDTGEGTFRRAGTWSASSMGFAYSSLVHELLRYFST